MYSAEFLARMKEKLMAEKQAVEEKIAKYSQDEEPMENPDLDDLGNDAVEDIVEEKVVEAHKNILDKVNIALDKIENGGYGICAETGEPIPAEMLEQVPWAHTCGVQK